MNIQVKLKIEGLQNKIRNYDYHYYALSAPLISDFEYDQLYKELEKLERENPELISADSPTQRVGSDITKEFKTFVHSTPMLSLANTYSKDELIDFAMRTGAPLEVVENLQALEDEGDNYETIEDIWPDYPTKEDFFFNEDEY